MVCFRLDSYQVKKENYDKCVVLSQFIYGSFGKLSTRI